MALNQTLIIERTDLENYLAFSQYLETKYINNLIFNCQYLYVRPLLCNSFYIELLAQIETNTLSYENAELVNGSADGSFMGLKLWLCWLVYAEYLASSNLFSTHSGVKIFQDQTSDSPTKAELQVEIDKAKTNADLFKNSVIEFLNANADNYPVWQDSCQQCNQNSIGNSKISWINKSKY